MTGPQRTLNNINDHVDNNDNTNAKLNASYTADNEFASSTPSFRECDADKINLVVNRNSISTLTTTDGHIAFDILAAVCDNTTAAITINAAIDATSISTDSSIPDPVTDDDSSINAAAPDKFQFKVAAMNESYSDINNNDIDHKTNSIYSDVNNNYSDVTSLSKFESNTEYINTFTKTTLTDSSISAIKDTYDSLIFLRSKSLQLRQYKLTSLCPNSEPGTIDTSTHLFFSSICSAHLNADYLKSPDPDPPPTTIMIALHTINFVLSNSSNDMMLNNNNYNNNHMNAHALINLSSLTITMIVFNIYLTINLYFPSSSNALLLIKNNYIINHNTNLSTAIIY